MAPLRELKKIRNEMDMDCLSRSNKIKHNRLPYLRAASYHVQRGRTNWTSYRCKWCWSNYHSYELETVAVVRSIKPLCNFLYDRKLTVVTDCNALKTFRYMQELLPRVHRWWPFLQNVNFDVEYRKRERLKHVNCFSKNHITQKTLNLTLDKDWLVMKQYRDPF